MALCCPTDKIRFSKFLGELGSQLAEVLAAEEGLRLYALRALKDVKESEEGSGHTGIVQTPLIDVGPLTLTLPQIEETLKYFGELYSPCFNF